MALAGGQTNTLPKVGQQYDDSAKLVILKTPKDRDVSAWRRVKSSFKFACQFQTPSMQDMVPKTTNNEDNPTVFFQINNIDVGPTIDISFHFQAASTADIVVHLYIPLSKVRPSPRSEHVRCISDIDASFINGREVLRVQAMVYLARGDGIAAILDGGDLDPRRFSVADHSLLTALRLLTDCSELGQAISLDLHRNRPSSDDWDLGSLSDLEKIIRGKEHPFKDQSQPLAWSMYRRGESIAHSSNLRSRSEVLRSADHPGLPFQPAMVYMDCDEALVRHVYFWALMDVEARRSIDAVMAKDHHVRLHSLDLEEKYIVAVVIFRKLPAIGLKDEQWSFPRDTKVSLEILMRSRRFKVEGRSIPNILNAPANSVSIAIHDAAKIVPKACLTPLHEGVPGHVSMEPQYIDTTTKTAIDAVVRFYGDREYLKKWPAFMNDGTTLDLVDPLAGAPSDVEKAFQAAKKKTETKHMWHRGQLEVLDGLRQMPGGILIVNGVPGGGKTLLLVSIAHLLASTGVKVLIISARNATLDHDALEFRREFGKNLLRVYPSQYGHLGDETNDQKGPIAAQACGILLGLVEDLAKAVKHQAAEVYTVDRAINDLLVDTGNVTVMGKFGSSGSRTDMLAFLKKQLYIIKTEHPLTDKKYWAENEMARLKDAYVHVRNYVISKVRIAAATPVVAAETGFASALSMNSKQRIILLIDEASCMSEAETLAPLVARYGAQIAGIVLLGDTRQIGPVAMASVELNEFRAQGEVSAMQRLIHIGHPVINLDVQQRMHAKLFEPANELFYELACSTFQHGNAHQLDEAESRLFARIRHGGLTEDESLGSLSLDYDDTKERMLWVKLDSAKVRRPKSGSRANLEHIDYVIKRVLPVIRSTYGMRTKKKVGIITPYATQRTLYDEALMQLKKDHGWAAEELPRVLTSDSALGHEFDLSIVDTVNIHDEGFLKDGRRVNVMFTRARKMQLVISGTFSGVTTIWMVKNGSVPSSIDESKQAPRLVRQPLIHYQRHYEKMKVLHVVTEAEWPARTSDSVPTYLQEIHMARRRPRYSSWLL